MIPFEGEFYFDDRLYILEVRRGIRSLDGITVLPERTSTPPAGGGQWLLCTRRNVPGYPPVLLDPFRTRAEAIAYLEQVEPEMPRISLGGASPSPTPMLKDYRAWLQAEGLAPSWIEPEPEERDQIFPVFVGETEACECSQLGWGWNDRRVNIPAAAEESMQWRTGPETPYRIFDALEKRAAGRERPFPWLIVVLDRPYFLRGHLLEVIQPKSGVTALSWVKDSEPLPTPIPPSSVTLIEIEQKRDLEQLVGRSPLIDSIWASASGLDTERHWMLLPRPLRGEWLRSLEAEDRDRLLHHFAEGGRERS